MLSVIKQYLCFVRNAHIRAMVIISVAIFFPVLAYSAPLLSSERVGEFSKKNLDGWEEKEFQGKTQYKIILLEGQNVLAAQSDSAASGLFKEVSIDLKKTPYINWSWKVDNILSGVDEKTKEGDDYSARIYVVSSGGLFIWKTKALDYVWSSNQPVGEAWPNAYTASAHMISVESGQSGKGKWKTYKRNVLEDFKHFYGADIAKIDVVAIMTDTDNTGLSAKAYYGDIYFTSE